MKLNLFSWIFFASLSFTIFGDETTPQPETEQYLEVDKDVQVELFTLKNPIKPQILELNDINSVIESNFDVKIPTRILIHGFQSNGEFKLELANAFFTNSSRNVNLIAINWEKASFGSYPTVRGYVELLGNFTADFISFLSKYDLIDLSNLSVIGFSLGAHIAGISGKRLKAKFNNKKILRKIVGLDPARVLFSINAPDERIHNTDAIYVETIHTSILGFYNPLGTVSFYPNGRSQPQCDSWNIACSHSSAYKYFAQSVISNEQMTGRRCESLNELKNGKCSGNKGVLGGEPGPTEQPPGIYYIKIN